MTETQVPEKVRFNFYLDPDLDDGLEALADQTKLSKNSLISLSVSKFLVDNQQITPKAAADEPPYDVIKRTQYCDVLAKGKTVDIDQTIATIERIFIHDRSREEIRFAYYKLNKNRNERLILRPLDLTEDELFILFIDAINNKVFTDSFLKKMKAILPGW